MSEESGKQFDPTPNRLAKARKDGDVARSAELGGALAFAAALAATSVVAGSIANAASIILASSARGQLNTGALAGLFAWALLPCACAAVAAAGGTWLQTGSIQFTALSIKLQRASPLEGLKRMFSRETSLHAVRAVIAVGCSAAAVAPLMHALFAQSGAGVPAALAQSAWQNALRGTFVLALIGALFGAADFAIVRGNLRKRLRMSFDELKRDQKEHDGDPTARSRRRAMHAQISRSSIRRLKDAAFVVTNPTHIAIACEYGPPQVCIPRVLIRAAGESALRVKAAAREQKIPLIENVALARQLYAHAKAGESIPRATFVAVAEVVAGLVRTGALRTA